jgi:predicted ATPase
LAIELAAGRVDIFGLGKTASLLDDRLNLSWVGRRTALPTPDLKRRAGVEL